MQQPLATTSPTCDLRLLKVSVVTNISLAALLRSSDCFWSTSERIADILSRLTTNSKEFILTRISLALLLFLIHQPSNWQDHLVSESLISLTPLTFWIARKCSWHFEAEKKMYNVCRKCHHWLNSFVWYMWVLFIMSGQWSTPTTTLRYKSTCLHYKWTV